MGLWIRVVIGWGLSGLAALWLPEAPRSAPVLWGYVNLASLTAAGLTLLAGWQLVKASGKAFSNLLYLPVGFPARLRSLFPLAAALGGIWHLVLQIPLMGPAVLLFFTGRELLIRRKKEQALMELKKRGGDASQRIP